MRLAASVSSSADGERRHHGQPRVADLAEILPQPLDALIEVRGERGQMVLLPVLAGHAELPAVDGDVDLRHHSRRRRRRAPQRMVSIAASRRRAISRLVASSSRDARPRHVELGGELRAVGAERMHLRGERVLAAVGLAAALGRGLQRVERRAQAAGWRLRSRSVRSSACRTACTRVCVSHLRPRKSTSRRASG